jgi:hypothetical protein
MTSISEFPARRGMLGSTESLLRHQSLGEFDKARTLDSHLNPKSFARKKGRTKNNRQKVEDLLH